MFGTFTIVPSGAPSREAAHEFLVDDADLRGAAATSRSLKGPPFREPDPERVEVSRARDLVVRRFPVRGVDRRVALPPRSAGRCSSRRAAGCRRSRPTALGKRRQRRIRLAEEARARWLDRDSGSSAGSPSSSALESARKPGSSAVIDASVRTSSPAPASSRTAPADFADGEQRAHPARPPVAPRPPAASDSPSGARAACHAGAIPNSRPVAPVRTAAKSVTRKSKCSAMPCGNSPLGIIDGATRSAAHDRARPAPPPIAASTRLSHKSSRAICARLAPSAARHRHLARPADPLARSRVGHVGATPWGGRTRPRRQARAMSSAPRR